MVRAVLINYLVFYLELVSAEMKEPSSTCYQTVHCQEKQRFPDPFLGEYCRYSERITAIEDTDHTRIWSHYRHWNRPQIFATKKSPRKNNYQLVFIFLPWCSYNFQIEATKRWRGKLKLKCSTTEINHVSLHKDFRNKLNTFFPCVVKSLRIWLVVFRDYSNLFPY